MSELISSDLIAGLLAPLERCTAAALEDLGFELAAAVSDDGDLAEEPALGSALRGEDDADRARPSTPPSLLRPRPPLPSSRVSSPSSRPSPSAFEPAESSSPSVRGLAAPAAETPSARASKVAGASRLRLRARR
ncbi:MAG: hypothetical protein KC457_33765, partial [Myxococcales bacterium]|nr:hypothetical protein [Myxococcales bacterium]